MLRLRRARVVSVAEADERIARLTVMLEGTDEEREAIAYPGLTGPVAVGDEVVLNVEARDIGLGSGGFDVLHCNLTRGLAGGGGDAHVMKLNYTSLQHGVEPIERPVDAAEAEPMPVLVLPLHGHLAPVAWSAAEARPGLKVGYVQTAGGGLPGTLSRDVAELRSRGLLAGHVTAGPAYGGEDEAIGLVGALDAAGELGWDAVVAGAGPGILGSETRYGHGGMATLDTAHAALALRMPTLVSPRLSAADPRPRHRGLSHHTAAVLELLLAPVQVPVPEVEAAEWPTPEAGREPGPEPGMLDELREACGDRHDLAVQPVDLEGYAASGLPVRTMGREIGEDPLFFAAALASGRALTAAASDPAGG